MSFLFCAQETAPTEVVNNGKSTHQVPDSGDSGTLIQKTLTDQADKY